jgi:DNA polymerase-3 subunit epsilon
MRIGEGIAFPVIDTMELDARLYRRLPGFFAWRMRTESIRLADSRSRYELPRYRAHHALTDALATAELLQAQVAYRFSVGTLLDEVWEWRVLGI